MGNEEMEKLMRKWRNDEITEYRSIQPFLVELHRRNIKACHQMSLESKSFDLDRITSSPSPDIILVVSLTRHSHSQKGSDHFTVQLIVLADSGCSIFGGKQSNSLSCQYYSLAGHTLSQERIWYFTMQRCVLTPQLRGVLTQQTY